MEDGDQGKDKSREDMARRPTEATEKRRWMKLSVSTRCSDCTASGKNRRRGGCSYGCARLCSIGKQIAAIYTRNMETFELAQKTCQKKMSKTIHKLEYKSRTRIRMRWLMGDLGRRSSWALGVGQSRPGRHHRYPTPQSNGIPLSGVLLSRMQLSDVL